MNKQILALTFCTLAISACSDSGEAGREALIESQLLGNNGSSDGISGEMAGETDSTIDDAGDTPADTDGGATDDVMSGDGTAAEPASDEPTSAEAPVTETAPGDVPVVTTGNQVILPSDCNIVSGNNGTSYCISASTGNRLFALNSDDTLRWTTILSETNSSAEPVIVPGDELFLLRPDSSGSSTLTSLDGSGGVRYEALLTGDFNTIVDGLFEQPYLFLHVKNSAGNSSILQIDAATGRQNRVRDFAGHNLSDFALEEFDGNRVLATTLNGVTNYLTLDELNDFNRIFSLDPTNFGERFPPHMANLRGAYTGEFISLLRNAVNLVDVNSTETEVACSASGSINLMPENSYISEQQFTRAYEFTDCDMNGTIANGTLIHTLFEIDTIAGRNGSESLQMEELSLSKENPSDDGGVFVEEKTLSATIRNVYVFNGEELSAERVHEINSYNHSFDSQNVLSVAGANYTRVIDTQGEDSPAGGFRLTETGSMRSIADRDGTIVVEITQPLVYLNSDSPEAAGTLDDAPLSGVIDLQAADSSTLSVDAGRAGVNQQNYTMTQRGTEITVDDIWLVAPVDTSLRILN